MKRKTEHFATLFLYFVANFYPSMQEIRFDICDVSKSFSTDDLANSGITLLISTGLRNNFIESRNPRVLSHCKIVLSLDSSKTTEISFREPPNRKLLTESTRYCLNFELEKAGVQVRTESLSCNTTQPSKKILIYILDTEKLTLRIDESVAVTDKLDFEILIKSQDYSIVEPKYVYATNKLLFKCDYENNDYLSPNLFKGDIDLTANLVNREYRHSLAGDTPKNASGRYDCTWGSSASDRRPLTSFYAVVYSTRVICEVQERNDVSNLLLTRNESRGSEIQLVVPEGTSLSNYRMLCSLAFGGTEESSKAATLDWEPPLGYNGPEQPFPETHTSNADLKSRGLLHSITVNGSVTYKCQLTTNVSIDGGKPQPCTIRFVTERVLEEEERSRSAGLWWITIIVAIVVIIIVVVVVVCVKVRSRKSKDGRTPVISETKSEATFDDVSIDTREVDLNDKASAADDNPSVSPIENIPDVAVVTPSPDVTTPTTTIDPPTDIEDNDAKVVYANAALDSVAEKSKETIGKKDENPYYDVVADGGNEILEETV